MMLTIDQLQDILGIVIDELEVDASDGRRAATRVHFGRRAEVRTRDKTGHPSRARVLLRDISIKGIGFLSDVPLAIGRSFVLHLNDSAEQPLYIVCITRRCERGGMGNASFIVGATFELFTDAETIPVDSTTSTSMSGIGSLLAHASALLRQLNPVRLVRHGFKRFDDYSSLEDTKWFHRSP